jgi:hypothetical protein
MKRIFFLAIVLASAVAGHAQTERVTVHAGESLAVAFAPNGFFRFAQFIEGSFLMKNGTQAKVLCNYNIATGEILYIKSTGDTLALGIPEDMEHVIMGENTEYIYNNKSYFEILAHAQNARLAKKIKVFIEKDKKGGYGESAPTSSQDQLSNFSWGTQLFHLGHDVVVTKTTSFHWVDKNNNLQPANKKNLLKLVSKDRQSKLEAYIEENKTDFNNEEHLRKLLTYAGTL